jgi:hypothetical protein
MALRHFMLDPITAAVKNMMEMGVAREVITGTLNISDETLNERLNDLYSRVFDIRSKNWSINPEHNKIFIQIQQQYLNDRLKARGYIFLNEVYEALGMERSAQGQLVGWFREPYSELIQFEIVDDTEDGGFIIAFNPHGYIYHKLPTF